MLEFDLLNEFFPRPKVLGLVCSKVYYKRLHDKQLGCSNNIMTNFIALRKMYWLNLWLKNRNGVFKPGNNFMYAKIFIHMSMNFPCCLQFLMYHSVKCCTIYIPHILKPYVLNKTHFFLEFCVLCFSV